MTIDHGDSKDKFMSKEKFKTQKMVQCGLLARLWKTQSLWWHLKDWCLITRDQRVVSNGNVGVNMMTSLGLSTDTAVPGGESDCGGVG